MEDIFSDIHGFFRFVIPPMVPHVIGSDWMGPIGISDWKEEEKKKEEEERKKREEKKKGEEEGMYFPNTHVSNFYTDGPRFMLGDELGSDEEEEKEEKGEEEKKEVKN